MCNSKCRRFYSRRSTLGFVCISSLIWQHRSAVSIRAAKVGGIKKLIRMSSLFLASSQNERGTGRNKCTCSCSWARKGKNTGARGRLAYRLGSSQQEEGIGLRCFSRIIGGVESRVCMQIVKKLPVYSFYFFSFFEKKTQIFQKMSHILTITTATHNENRWLKNWRFLIWIKFSQVVGLFIIIFKSINQS